MVYKSMVICGFQMPCGISVGLLKRIVVVKSATTVQGLSSAAATAGVAAGVSRRESALERAGKRLAEADFMLSALLPTFRGGF